MCGVVEHEMEICPKLCICHWVSDVEWGYMHPLLPTLVRYEKRCISPLTVVCMYGEGFNLKPRFRIYYIYIFPSRVVFIMNLHSVSGRVCLVHGKQTNPSWLKIQVFVQRFHTDPSEVKALRVGTCSASIKSFKTTGCTEVLKIKNNSFANYRNVLKIHSFTNP